MLLLTDSLLLLYINDRLHLFALKYGMLLGRLCYHVNICYLLNLPAAFRVLYLEKLIL